MESGRTVHVIDDEMTMRRSMRYALKTAGYDVQDWGSGDEFVKAARSVCQGCVLLDYRMPGLDGLEVQRELNERGVAMPVIVMTGHGDISVAVSAMKAGAIDFLEKPFERAQLLAAVNTAFEEIDRSHATDARASNAVHILRVLTPREFEVLEGLAQGLPNKSIAHDLGISRRTVEVHRANLMTKLAVHNFSDALRIAFAAGLGRKTRSVVP